MTPRLEQRPFTHVRPRPVGADGAIVHSMAELIQLDGKQIPAWEFLEGEGLSVHALIHPDGHIVETATPQQIAHHAGTSHYQGHDYLNSTFLGAEFLVAGAHNYDSWLHRIAMADAYTAAQYDAGGFLYASWLKFCPKLTISRILGHSEVSGDDVRGQGHGKRDPGVGFDWPRFRQSVLAWTTILGKAA